MNEQSLAMSYLLCFGILFLSSSCINDQSSKKYEDTVDIPVNQEMNAELTSPPYVPTPIGRRMTKTVFRNTANTT